MGYAGDSRNTRHSPHHAGLVAFLSLLGVLTWICAPTSALHAQEEPALPSGLEGENTDETSGEEPALPGGLDGEDDSGQPELPPGLDEPKEQKPSPPPAEKDAGPWDLSGFWEARGGLRTQRDRYQRQASIGETRFHAKALRVWREVEFTLTGDLLADAVARRHRPRLEEGRGFLDLREASASFSPLESVDMKIGRQILTWGTGDLIFINDMFPKDWQAFFIGRDQEYLKAPSDAIKTSFFTAPANLDVVFSPRLDPDRFISGRRVSYYNGARDRLAGNDVIIEDDAPNEYFKDFELACRLSRKFGGYELAGYAYTGYWKSPAGMNAVTGRATFPRLNVYGASARAPLAKGIANAEFGYYDSRQDADGDNPLVNNGEVRMLAGYERDVPEIARDLTLAGQYYVEQMTDYGAYRRALPPGAKQRDEFRHVVTCRITQRLMNQTLTLSLFGYYSPSDADAYLRPNVQFKIDDHWTAEVGGNVFFGAHTYTFFGQFRNNTNLYAALRYSF